MGFPKLSFYLVFVAAITTFVKLTFCYKFVNFSFIVLVTIVSASIILTFMAQYSPCILAEKG